MVYAAIHSSSWVARINSITRWRGPRRHCRRNPAYAGSARRRLAASLSQDVSDTFRSHLRGMHAARRKLAVIAGLVCVRVVVPGERDFAAQHHYAQIEVVRVQILG